MTFKDFLASLSEDERYYVEERAAIHEFDGGLNRTQAEQRAFEEQANRELELFV